MAALSSIKLPLKFLQIVVLLFKTQKIQAHFVLEYEIVSITIHAVNCGEDESTPECETYLSI